MPALSRERAMILKGLNHLAFITPSMEKTIRFYRDLLERLINRPSKPP